MWPCSTPTRRSRTRWLSWTWTLRPAAYGELIGQVNMTGVGDELHHFGWNACSSCLCPYSPHPHMERRYLVVPGMRSSRIHVLDTKPNPREPRLVKVIEPEEVPKRTGYSRPHTAHCGPDGIYMNALGICRGQGTGRDLRPRSPKRSKSGDPGSRIADRSTSPTTSGGTWVTTP